ncbi:MAG: hypothetical protein LBD45_07755, partial [Bacteroidales bacterium]|nr:hypothetical protein [Bacteroidales bacterium]
MKKKYVVFCTLLICGFAAIAAQEVSRSFYVSSSEGDDDNDGMSVTRPMKTVQALYLKYRDADNMLRNCCINLKSNDIFYESVRYLDSCIVTSYGNGRKPLLCGFLKLTKKNRWKKVKNRPTVWRIDFSSENDFTGFHPSLSMNPEFAHDIGVIYDEKSNTIHGRMLQSLDSLKNEWDFFTSDKTPSNSESIYPHELFLCHRNPNKETQLNFSSYAIGIYNLTNCTVRNLAVKGFAHHGMAGLRNTTVEFCEVDVIGGAIQPNYPAWTRFGNGIECWIGNTANDNDTIRNCRISRTFDCGASIQGISVRMKNAKNIHFINNVFEHCRQAFEHFLVPQDNELSTYNDCEFSGNICL